MVKRAAAGFSNGNIRPDPQAAKIVFVEAAQFFSEGELVQAEKSLDRHLQMQPGSWPGLCLKALIAGRTHREALAEQLWTQLLGANPAHVDGHCQLGLLCDNQRRFAEAQMHFQHALQLEPRNITAHLGLGMVFQRQGMLERAKQFYQSAMVLDPSSAPAHFNMGMAWQEAGNIEQAITWFARVLTLDPLHPSAASNFLYCQHFMGHVTAEDRFAQAVRFGQDLESRIAAKPARDQLPEPDRRLRIGFVSGDLREHPVGYFLENVLHEFGSLAFELIAFSNSAQQDGLTARIKPCFVAWHVVDTLSDAALAEKIRGEKVDILVDLAGHTAGNRLPVFAARAAPVQVAWLGYFATTGLSRMDYVLADAHCVPVGQEQHFTETVWRLPQTRLCFTPPADAPPVSALPSSSGHPFTYGCFQDLTKLDDGVLQAWSRILLARPQARIRLQSVKLGHTEVQAAFCKRLAQWGLPLDRVQLLGPVSRLDYLKAYAAVDIVLDTFPFPGGTTTVEALWMGVPTLTLSAPGMLGCQGTSLLTNAGLGEWGCHDIDDYVAKAIGWADAAPATRQALSDLRSALRNKVQACPLFDAPRFAQHFGNALREMWRIWCASQSRY